MNVPVLKVTATEANRSFSKLFKRAKAGERIVITDRGKDAVMMVPQSAEAADERGEEEIRAKRRALFEAYMEELKKRPVMNLGKFSRDWAYDD
jgi:prevent-host-death family protein